MTRVSLLELNNWAKELEGTLMEDGSGREWTEDRVQAKC